jgi:hypothetical protein
MIFGRKRRSSKDSHSLCKLPSFLLLLLLSFIRFFFSKTRSTTHNRTEHNLPTQTHMRIEETYININNSRRQQFPRPTILTPDDDHIGRNMQ